MNSRQRVYAALRKEPIDRVPVFMWFHPATTNRLAELLEIPAGDAHEPGLLAQPDKTATQPPVRGGQIERNLSGLSFLRGDSADHCRPCRDGADVLNPVQGNCPVMDPLELKKEFGDRLAFMGGMDTQDLLPNGSPDDVRKVTARLVEGMTADGEGYILAASHTVPPETPTRTSSPCTGKSASPEKTYSTRLRTFESPLALEHFMLNSCPIHVREPCRTGNRRFHRKGPA